MDNTDTITLQELKQFMRNVAAEFNVSYKDVVHVWNKHVVEENEEMPETENPKVSEDAVEEPVSATCVAVKKDKTVCGKKATVGDRCGVHKPRTAKASTSKQDHGPAESRDINAQKEPAPSDQQDDDDNHPAVLAMREMRKKAPLSVHRRLGLLWDLHDTRFVFSKRPDGTLVVIARYDHTTRKLTDKDIEKCKEKSFQYAVTNLLDIRPEFPDEIDIDGEYDRIRFQVENDEYDERKAREAAEQLELPPPHRGAEQSAVAPTADGSAIPATFEEVSGRSVPELIGLAASLGLSNLGDVTDKRKLVTDISNKILNPLPPPEVLPSVSANAATEPAPRVKNLSQNPRKFPKKRKDTKAMDIVDALAEITLSDHGLLPVSGSPPGDSDETVA